MAIPKRLTTAEAVLVSVGIAAPGQIVDPGSLTVPPLITSGTKAAICVVDTQPDPLVTSTLTRVLVAIAEVVKTFPTTPSAAV